VWIYGKKASLTNMQRNSTANKIFMYFINK
jgi:hypothetical protein